jgi:predicted ribosome quality control (RQC) complex YloA/Tae2 family protein
MHTNYYFLRQLSRALYDRLNGYTVVECFTQNKDELYIEFTGEQTLWMQVRVSPQFTAIAFPDDVKRARRNSTDVFPELIGRKVESVIQTPYDRSFTFNFDQETVLLVKFHGNRSNIILLKKNIPVKLFKSKLKSDWEISPKSLASTLNLSLENFIQLEGNLSRFWPVAGKEVKAHLLNLKTGQLSPEEQVAYIQNLHQKLENPEGFYIEEWNGKPTVTLFQSGREELFFSIDPVETTTNYYRRITQDYFLNQRKTTLLNQINKRIKSTESYLVKSSQMIKSLQGKRDLSQQADVLMANLHQIPKGAKKVELLNFYTNQPQVYKLKHDLNAQQNAERLYKRAKNQHKEHAHLQTNISEKEERLLQLMEWQEAINAAYDFNQIKELEKLINPQFTEEDSRKPYWEEVYRGWQIWVGRGAADNDSMLRYFSNKDDWWLHAKDAAGSHVLVKYQAGQTAPALVLERAAALAAYHSKRRSDTLCPVICTRRKWVRKRKGSAPGMVAVDREEQVILVAPEG